MPVYQIEAPDRKVYKVEAPEGASEAEALQWFKGQWQTNRDGLTPSGQARGAGRGEMRAPEGFVETVQNPITLMEEESIPKHLIDYFTTPAGVYEEQAKTEKRDVINSTPAMQDLTQSLDYLDKLVANGTATKEQMESRDKLIDAYGTLYDKLEKAYDSGEMQGGFSWEGLKSAIKEDPGGMVGEFVNALAADPYAAMIPAGWAKVAERAGAVAKAAGAGAKTTKAAEVSGGIAGTSTLGSSFAAADSAAEQLSEEGEVDSEKVKSAATIGAITTPLLVGGWKAGSSVAKAGSRYRFNKQIQKATSKVESKAQEYLSRGLNDPEAAVTRAINNTFIPTRVRKELGKRNKFIDELNLSDEAVAIRREEIAQKMGTLRGKLGKKFNVVADNVRGALGALDIELGKISKPVFHKVNQQTMDAAVRIKDALAVKERYAKMARSLSKEDYDRLGWALSNGDLSLARRITNHAMELEDVLKYLDHKFDEGKKVGMDMGRVEGGYWPRAVKDYETFMFSKGISPSKARSVLADELNRKFKLAGTPKAYHKSSVTFADAKKVLTPDEYVSMMNKVMGAFRGRGEGKSIGRHTKARTIEELSQEDMKFYNDHIEELTNYINSMEMAISERAMFGGVAKKYGAQIPTSRVEYLNKSIGATVSDLLERGQILESDVEPLAKLLQARYVDGMAAPNRFVQGTKNLLYSATLGNPFSAGTQLGDLGGAAYVTSVADALATVPMVSARMNKLKMEDFGLNNIIQEFEHLGKTAKVLDQSLKWSGFKAVDRLGKETILNASLRKYGRMAKTSKGRKELYDTYKDAFTPEEMTKALDDLANGEVSWPVKYMMWHQLARVQPISLTQMPKFYLQHPNLRMFYMLKTFALRQLNLVRREAYQKIRSGDVQGGVTNLVRYAGLIGLSNASVEQAKGWVRGDDVEFDDRVIANLYKNYGLSDYVLKKIGEGQVGTAISSAILPPISVLDQSRIKSMKSIPPFGEGWAWLFGMEDEEE